MSNLINNIEESTESLKKLHSQWVNNHAYICVKAEMDEMLNAIIKILSNAQLLREQIPYRVPSNEMKETKSENPIIYNIFCSTINISGLTHAPQFSQNVTNDKIPESLKEDDFT